ncbi:MAG: nanT 1 [Gemmatimonadetes bacterium]|nr:nanT 1 [Gemmatimonadota bacterium]
MLTTPIPTSARTAPDASRASAPEATRLSELSPQQWKSGTAAWLGWLFDGLDMHLYTLVATPVVIQLIGAVSSGDPGVKEKSAYIQAAFLLGWALGGSFFGRLGDILGRSRALSLTILTYALCTGLCAFAQTWWQLMLFRFVAALGIGGEWAVGASLISETWPKGWRPWLAAMLQTGVNIGILGAAITVWLLSLVLPPHADRYVFLVGVLPAFLVFWIRRHVPEPEAWRRADQASGGEKPRARELFRGEVAAITLRTTVACALGLSGWWLFQFWQSQHLRRLLVDAGSSPGEVTRIVSASFFAVNALAIVGNFSAGWFARTLGNRRAIVLFLAGLGLGIIGAFIVPRSIGALAWFWFPMAGFFSGVFALFTMYLPPLFPTLLRTTGAGFCYNIGRIAAAVCTIVFGLLAPVNDYRVALLYAGALLLIAAVWSWWLPETPRDLEAV